MSQKPTGRYNTNIRNEAKFLYVEQEWTLEQISKHFEERPRVSTLGNWKRKPDEQSKTWDDYKQESQERKYIQMSPDGMAGKLIERIWALLNDKSISGSKMADALSKMQKGISELMNPKHQIPVMFQMLEDLVIFTRDHHPECFNDAFKKMILAFKNRLRGRLEYDTDLSLTQKVGEVPSEYPK